MVDHQNEVLDYQFDEEELLGPVRNSPPQEERQAQAPQQNDARNSQVNQRRLPDIRDLPRIPKRRRPTNLEHLLDRANEDLRRFEENRRVRERNRNEELRRIEENRRRRRERRNQHNQRHVQNRRRIRRRSSNDRNNFLDQVADRVARLVFENNLDLNGRGRP
ncbi:hypothetical protein CAEBREN_32114 [Caenorhabditis brenneri]|uniref:Uncharacterized protein n=1 Tax=Caenorhabditis brenneri TaxID=135651 RepID=G0PJ22_CAEBE|nr:hypothetical protein CAEBREN_32114 [Caenorhabditis brenneri]